MDNLERETPRHENHSIKEFFLAFGTILFAFGGASTFPTIQNDMFNRNQFHKSVRIAFAGIANFVAVILVYLHGSNFRVFIFSDSAYLSPNHGVRVHSLW